MTVAELILRYIETLVWPVTLLSGLFLFRHQLVRLVDRLSHASLPGGTELDFQVGQVTERATKELEEQLVGPLVASEDSPILETLRKDPGLGMAQLRIELERVLRSLFELRHPSSAGKRITPSLGGLIRELESAGDLPRPLAAYLRDVIPLANRAIHGERVSTESAENLGELGVKLLGELRQLYMEKAVAPLRTWEISQEAMDKLQEGRYKVLTVIPLVEHPSANEYELTQEQLDMFLEGYEEFAEFLVAVEPIAVAIPKPK
ncbi:MAG: hypothetical protein HYU30_02240 [Chloroflexi bacterium]|nr:hypothetical protein [Chloroflexota bacterium]